MRPLTATRAPVIHRAKPLSGPDAEFQSADADAERAEPKLRLRGGRFFRRGKGRADPAPSRFSYRFQRWMLTPGIRLGVKIGVPLCAVLATVGLYFAAEDRREAVRAQVDNLITSFQERPEFMVKLMAIDGAGAGLADDIREVVPLDFPLSSWDLDVEQIRDTITGLDPVKSATVRIRPGGILQVDVVERQPVIVWRTREGIQLLDETGTHVAEIAARTERSDLPLIAGQGADQHVAEALELLATARSLGSRVRGLVRCRRAALGPGSGSGPTGHAADGTPGACARACTGGERGAGPSGTGCCRGRYAHRGATDHSDDRSRQRRLVEYKSDYG